MLDVLNRISDGNTVEGMGPIQIAVDRDCSSYDMGLSAVLRSSFTIVTNSSGLTGFSR